MKYLVIPAVGLGIGIFSQVTVYADPVDSVTTEKVVQPKTVATDNKDKSQQLVTNQAQAVVKVDNPSHTANGMNSITVRNTDKSGQTSIFDQDKVKSPSALISTNDGVQSVYKAEQQVTNDADVANKANINPNYEEVKGNNTENISFIEYTANKTSSNNTLKISGTFTAGGTINFRDAPSTSSRVEGSYATGQSVNYDQKVSSEGYDWISWIGYSGARRYMVERVIKTNDLWGKDSNNTFPDNSKSTQPTSPKGKTIVSKIISKARTEIGKPYVYGAAGPNSFDCSGLVQYVYAAEGIKLPRTSEQQAKLGKAVSLNSLKPGDLLFWENNGDAYHVAIYTGSGNCLFAPEPGQNVKEQPMSYWMPQFARRVL